MMRNSKAYKRLEYLVKFINNETNAEYKIEHVNNAWYIFSIGEIKVPFIYGTFKQVEHELYSFYEGYSL